MKLENFKIIGMDHIVGRGIILKIRTEESPEVGDTLTLVNTRYVIIGIEKTTVDKTLFGLIVKEDLRMLDQEIQLGSILKYYDGTKIFVRSFKVYPVPAVSDGIKWYNLSDCIASED